MLYAIFAVLVIILDQGMKYWVSGAIHMESAGETFIPGILSIVNVHNDGAAFSFLSGSNARIYFIILTGVFTVAVIIALATKFISGPLARWSIVFVMAGGLSNCIDRVIYGYVQDMFKCEFINFPVFNVADIFITVFALLFVIAIIFERDRRDDYDFDDEFNDDDDEEEEEEERPRKLSRKEKRAQRRAEREAEDEDEEEEEPAPRARRAAPQKKQAEPVRKAAVQQESSGRKARASKYDAEFEEFKARKARAAAQKQAAAAVEQEPEPVAVPQKPVAPKPVAKPAPVEKPAAPAAPAKPAEPKPFVSSSDSEFSLDDILAEFK